MLWPNTDKAGLVCALFVGLAQLQQAKRKADDRAVREQVQIRE